MREIKECRDLYGPLSENNKRMLLEMLRRPAEKTWQQARRIVVSAAPIITLEMAVKMISPSWVSAVPDSFTVRRAILYALKAQRDFRHREATWHYD